MKVHFSFAAFFSSIIGIDSIELELPDGTTVGSAIDLFLKNNPEYFRLFDEKNLFLLGDFRAIYHINRLVVKNDYILNDGDELKILKAFIGG